MATTTTKTPGNTQSGAGSGSAHFAVEPGEVASILALPIPRHETFFDERLLHDLVARSLSITREEKEEIVLSMARFSQEQIDTVIGILTCEKQKFQELNDCYARRLAKLEEHRADATAAVDAEAFIVSVFGPT